MVNLVIPMAGLGSRFTKAGYQVPKPMLPIHEALMYEVVISNLFSSHLTSITLVAPTRFGLGNRIQRRKGSIEGVATQVIEVDNLTDGPARTVSIALDRLDKNLPVLVANSDQYMELNADTLYERLLATKTGGVIVAMEDDDPKWSFARLDSMGFVVEVAEKKVISKYATAGIYGFCSGATLEHAIFSMDSADHRTNGELYVGPAYNYIEGFIGKAELLNLGPVGRVMHGLGVPEDYELFLRKAVSRKAANEARKLFQSEA